jgi:hypothetical protein
MRPGRGHEDCPRGADPPYDPAPVKARFRFSDRHLRTELSVAVRAGTVAGTLVRVKIACDAWTILPELDALARGGRVPLNVEPWQVVRGTLPPEPEHAPLA